METIHFGPKLGPGRGRQVEGSSGYVHGTEPWRGGFTVVGWTWRHRPRWIMGLEIKTGALGDSKGTGGHTEGSFDFAVREVENP